MRNIKDYTYKFKSPYGEEYNLIPVKGNYAKNDSLAVSLFDVDSMEDYAMITRCFPTACYSNGKSSFVDTNNCSWAPKFIEENKLGEPTGCRFTSGYCSYPEYTFDDSKMLTYDELAEYYRTYKSFKPQEENTSESNNKIRVLCKEPNGPLEEKYIENDIHVLQEYVKGYIDMTNLPGTEDIDIICNDEFLYNGSLPNITMPERRNVLCGPLIFAGFNEEDGSTISLTDEQIEKVQKYVKANELKSGIDIYGAFDEMSKRSKVAEM